MKDLKGKLQLIKNLITTFLPNGLVSILGLGFLLYSIGFEDSIYTLTLFNIVALVLSLKFSIIIHELGHYFFATLFEMNAGLVVFGSGFKVGSINLFNTKFQLNNKLNSGYVLATNVSMHGKWKKILFLAGGSIFNFISIIILYLLFKDALFEKGKVLWAGFVIISSAFLGLFSLIPISSKFFGGKTAHDGKLILEELRGKSKVKSSSTDYLNAVYLLSEKKDFQLAYDKIKELQVKGENKLSLMLLESMALMGLGKFSNGYVLLKSIEGEFENYKEESSLSNYYNTLAWFSILNDEFVDAEKYSALAVKDHPNFDYYQNTRAIALIETENFKEGCDILAKNLDLDFIDPRNFSALIYLCYSNTKYGVIVNAEKYKKYLEDHQDEMAADIKYLYEKKVVNYEKEENLA
ncbi:site-2 protease family protein [Aureibacter tunicatorum]|uniref:Peptidase M50 domain-containing protein n=1 Tax=Aureibacter tunicatorum TaxID=866807 RepID=A0AAE4BSE6_9BACT|nr:site-2 protease family protein [Aureibacter tunicatorum]MDR6238780.1 hypothetical protein [Aureibacter tunicatorum]BDD05290.1 hypothetical protein AUTU_27730 [Aureibacter tunicatorum]